jgi:hypothetical protein
MKIWYDNIQLFIVSRPIMGSDKRESIKERKAIVKYLPST